MPDLHLVPIMQPNLKCQSFALTSMKNVFITTKKNTVHILMTAGLAI